MPCSAARSFEGKNKEKQEKAKVCEKLLKACRKQGETLLKNDFWVHFLPPFLIPGRLPKDVPTISPSIEGSMV
jgi:hypothetical protein